MAPILAFLLLGIADLARIYTTMITVEAAAREAADYGTVYPWRWSPANRAGTEQAMRDRACLAVRNLPDYVGPDDACTNPSVTIAIDPTPAGVPEDECSEVPRSAVPCNVTITLGYVFDIIVPVSIPFGETSLGFPSTLSFERTSTFAMSDFEIDEPLAP